MTLAAVMDCPQGSNNEFGICEDGSQCLILRAALIHLRFTDDPNKTIIGSIYHPIKAVNRVETVRNADAIHLAE
jgi:hypothetical protein